MFAGDIVSSLLHFSAYTVYTPHHTHTATFLSVQAAAVASKEVKRAIKSVKSSLSDVGIDTKNVEKNAKRFSRGLNKLWKGAKKTVGEIDLESVKESISESVEGVRKGLQNLGGDEIVVVGDFQLRIERLIAEGGFSTVFEVTDQGNRFALKRILCQTREAEKDAKMEVRLLQMMTHENIIPLLASCSAPKIVGDRTFSEYILLFPYIEVSKERTKRRAPYDKIAR